MLNRAREWWERLGRTNQLTLVLTMTGVLVTLIGFVVWAGTPEYRPLFSNLSAQDANAIKEKLTEAGVPSRLNPGGTTIEVPAQYVDEMKIKILSQNLPSQSPNAQANDDLSKINTMTMTSAVEQQTINHVLENRVSNSIMALQQIASASVHYAAPDNNPLVMSNHDASAAIVVTCKPGSTLSPDNVRAIVRLTQMSFTGLSEKNISLVSSNGDLLWDPNHIGNVTGADIASQEREKEKSVREKLQSALTMVCGPHSSIVTVLAEMNPDDVVADEVNPTQGVATQVMTDTEHLNGKGTVNGNVVAPGANANVPGLPGAPAGAAAPTYTGSSTDANGSYTHESSSKILEPGKIVKHTHTGPGKLNKLSVSVLLDKNKYKDPALLTEAETKIKETVATTIGLAPSDTSNSRLVSVVSMPFDRSQEILDLQTGEQQKRAELIRQLAGLVVPFVVMGIALFLLARALRRTVPLGNMPALAGAGMGALSGGPSLMLDGNGVPFPGQRVGDAEEVDGNGDPLGISQALTGPKTYEVIEEAFDSHLESILHLARSKPEMVAMLLKSWISEEQ